MATLFRDAGFPCERTSRGVAQSADVAGVRGLSIEVKRQEHLNIWACMAQSISQAGRRIPVLYFRRDRSEWLVTLRHKDFIQLYQDSYDAGDGGHVERKERDAPAT